MQFPKSFQRHRITLFWATVIIILCSVSFGKKIGESHLFFPGFDKLVHCGLFFVFTLLMCLDYLRTNTERHLTIFQLGKCILFPVLFGALIEILQLYLFTWRSGEWADLFADTVGTLMAVFAIASTLSSINKHKPS